jgi:hypothetical protein
MSLLTPRNVTEYHNTLFPAETQMGYRVSGRQTQRNFHKEISLLYLKL